MYKETKVNIHGKNIYMVFIYTNEEISVNATEREVIEEFARG